MTAPWRIETTSGDPATFFGPVDSAERRVRFLNPHTRAVVLGSTQPESDIDPSAAAAADTKILRRRSGGGAVLVGPGVVLWTDVVVPVGDPLWQRDVGRSFWWLGDVWVAALADAGLPGAAAWRGALIRSSWSARVCFAGIGPGEVCVGPAKVLGMSQRRSSAGSHFQCALAVEWRPADLLGLMTLDGETRRRAERELSAVAIGVGPDVATRVTTSFAIHLP